MFRAVVLSLICLLFPSAVQAKTMTRKDYVQPVEKGRLHVVPTFVSCSVYFGSPELKNIRLEFRKKSAEQPWVKALPPLYYPEFENYRGSIVVHKAFFGL